MKPVKSKEIRELGVTEIKTRISEARENLFKLRLRKGTRQLEDGSSLRVARRDIARMETVLRQKALAAIAK